eukprot:SAG22_NODE_339_length_12034_cov_3.087474_4_plen_85_part_00
MRWREADAAVVAVGGQHVEALPERVIAGHQYNQPPGHAIDDRGGPADSDRVRGVGLAVDFARCFGKQGLLAGTIRWGCCLSVST